MNSFDTKKYLTLAVLSLVLSLAIVRWNTTANVSFCHFAAGCRDHSPKGTITERTYGAPLAYKKTTSFRPNNSDPKQPNYAGYTQTSLENQSFSVPSVLVNVLFWFGLLHLLSGFVRRKKPDHSVVNVHTPENM